MKKVILNNICLISVFCFGLSFTSCSDDDPSASPIELKSVTTISDLSTPISQAALGDFIAIHGTGLEKDNIDSVLVNDVKVDLRETYIEKSILYMGIPVKLPLVETDKIYIYNKMGCQEIPFKAVPPALHLERMFNEYTAPGDTIMIYGNFFNLYEINAENAIVDFNGKKSKVIASSDTYLTTQVPKDVDKNIKVKVLGTKYNVEATCPGYYYDNHCMIMDFDNLVPDTKTYIMTDPKDKQRLSGNYLKIDNNSGWSGWWYIADIGGTQITDDMLDHPENYEVKCEFRTATQFVKDKIKFCTYLFWDAAPMEWTPEDFKFQNFNRWETITLPFVVNRSSTYTDNGYYHSFNIRLETEESFSRNFSFDNFRIYKKGE